MKSAFNLGISYGIIMFGAGFCVGTVRVLLVVPAVGHMWAVLMELPIMIWMCWRICAWLLGKWGHAVIGSSLLLASLTALVTLLLLEFALSCTLFGKTAQEFQADLLSTTGLIGLVAQAVCSLFLAVQKNTSTKLSGVKDGRKWWPFTTFL
jgi:hypothetical protein